MSSTKHLWIEGVVHERCSPDAWWCHFIDGYDNEFGGEVLDEKFGGPVVPGTLFWILPRCVGRPKPQLRVRHGEYWTQDELDAIQARAKARAAQVEAWSG